MASFKKAFAALGLIEGGYSNDPLDAGGETYRGISRRNFPEWDGWKIVDKFKSEGTARHTLQYSLKDNESLDELVSQFYHHTFWVYLYGDQIKDQEIATELFEQAVNIGKSRAVGFLQKSLNVLNRDEKLYSDIVEDGKFGPITYSTLKKALGHNLAGHLFKILNILQGAHYVYTALKRKSQERFLRGWLSRVEIKKR